MAVFHPSEPRVQGEHQDVKRQDNIRGRGSQPYIATTSLILIFTEFDKNVLKGYQLLLTPSVHNRRLEVENDGKGFVGFLVTESFCLA